MIKKVPIITLESITGGPEIEKIIENLRFHAFDFKMGGSSEPSSLSISFFTKEKIQRIDPNGTPELDNDTYKDLDSLLGEKFLFKIKNDNSQNELFLFYGFIVDLSHSLSESGDTGTIVMKDTSIETLDLLFIGLKGKDCSDDFSSEGRNHLKCLGQPIDPCPFLKEAEGLVKRSVFEDAKAILTKLDPCNPCDSQDREAYDKAVEEILISCATQKLISFPDFDYSLKDLMKIGVIKNSKNTSRLTPGSDDRADYSGTLRSVLNQWCQDIGITFHWNFSEPKLADALVFDDFQIKKLDLVKIKSYFKDCQIIDTSYKSNIESKRKGKSLRLRLAGHAQSYECRPESGSPPDPSRLKIFHNLGVEDIVRKEVIDKYKSVENLIAAAVIGGESATLRDIFVFEKIYESLIEEPMPLLGFNGGHQVLTSFKASINTTTYTIKNFVHDKGLYETCREFEEAIRKSIGRYYRAFESPLDARSSYSSNLGDVSRMDSAQLNHLFGGQRFIKPMPGNNAILTLREDIFKIIIMQITAEEKIKASPDHFPLKITHQNPVNIGELSQATVFFDEKKLPQFQFKSILHPSYKGDTLQSHLGETTAEFILTKGILFVSRTSDFFKAILPPLTFNQKKSTVKVRKIKPGEDEGIKSFITNPKLEKLEIVLKDADPPSGEKIISTSINFTNQDVSEIFLEEHKERYECQYNTSEIDTRFDKFKNLVKGSLKTPFPIQSLEINIAGFLEKLNSDGQVIAEKIDTMISDGLISMGIRINTSNGFVCNFIFLNSPLTEPKDVPDIFDEKTGQRNLIRTIISNSR